MVEKTYFCHRYFQLDTMLRFLLSVLFLFVPCVLFMDGKSSVRTTNEPDTTAMNKMEAYADLYRSMRLEGVIKWKAFRQAVIGYYKIENRRKDILTLIDFSRPSTEKRLFVIDMKQRKLLFSSVVSHGKNSGDNYATSFSNEYGSYKSSLGFYLTESTYQGKNGYSLILNGLEKGINDRARERSIVMHGAAYADPSVAIRGGRLGRSFGCPAVRLFGCSVARLLGCSVARPLGGIGGAAAGRIDVSGDAGCIPAVLSGIGFRLAFRTSFPGLFRDLLFRSQDSSVQFLPQQLPAAGV